MPISADLFASTLKWGNSWGWGWRQIIWQFRFVTAKENTKKIIMERDIDNLYTKTANGKFACNLCKHVGKRFDNLKRHIFGKHFKEKVTCECGRFLSKAAMSRHKKTSCAASKQQTADLVTTVEDHIVDSFKLQLIKSADGSVCAKHDPIQVDGYSFTLVRTETGMVHRITNFQSFYRSELMHTFSFC